MSDHTRVAKIREKRQRIWVGFVSCNDYRMEICNDCAVKLFDVPTHEKDHPLWVSIALIRYPCILCGKK